MDRAVELPDSLSEIDELIGRESMRRLVAYWGGMRLYFPQPRTITAGHILARTIGFDEARALAGRFQGLAIEIPRAASIERQERNSRIRAEYDQGKPAGELARAHRMTERQIRNILRSV